MSALIKKKVQTDENVGANDKGFNRLNKLSNAYKSTRKFLKAVLLSIYGSASPYLGC